VDEKSNEITAIPALRRLLWGGGRHWGLDVAFREDESRLRRNHGT